MQNISRRTLLAGTLSLAAGTLAACGSNDSTTTSTSVIRVGSKDFTESTIVAELFSLALEDAGFTVERVFNIAGSLIHESLVSGDIDLYPEYTGTGLITILGMDPLTDPDETYQTVKAAYKEQFNIEWLDYALANDGQGIFMSKRTSDRLGITTLSQMQEHASELRFCSQGEFDEREDGIPGIERVYGPLDWASSRVYDNGLKYTVVDNDEADCAPAYTTEGMLAQTDKFVLLEDDKQLWPPYNLAPVVKAEVLEENTALAETLALVTEQLDTATLTELNAKVDVDQEEYDEVADEFWSSINS